ncbi:MAG TPA: ABC transporter ATP-binding protein [Thermodesulfovibrio thiophilus]|uniref:ABC transporter ATP-binding protein n=1 Tax=Thermodesulfovibrio thiophilus TaxID=340095 RepID=UPI00040263C2|nr:ABC transporter ATP-binding protein [Thermodesulfovibrio thiophilus]HHW20223.1 ABC transporter ATP-binding protein [Thermodesulfovibrio thiophilus]HOA83008.1 ABC transporter ATP-binding protein [Thermodesulfovibrio thiophilus]HQA03492.1 ABC transporter ATP-binding protein [Thermodesulfovibrio thiophilus]HQD36083.1 ABC transporter ATP-binding protein [Thermodesulfovibrio thiophilus]
MLLQVQNLSIQYKNSTYIDNVNFHINTGEIFSIVGESGSGKTLTGLSIINLLPDYFLINGKLIFKNQNILTLSYNEIINIRGRQIACIFQDPMASLNPVLKIGYQVAEMFIYHNKLSKKEALEQTKQLLQKFKIAHTINSYPHELSGGMRQRVMIAMAVACEPDLIIADEPTTALDVTVQEEILDLLYLLVKKENRALILITHDINILGEYADRVMVMYAGRIMEMASVEEIFKNPLHPYTRALLDCVPGEKKKIEGIPGNVPDFKQLPQGCVFHPRCKYTGKDCINKSPSLYEVAPGHMVSCFLH